MFSKEDVESFEKNPNAYKERLSYASFSRLKNIVDNRNSMFTVAVYGDEKGVTVWGTEDETGAISILSDARNIITELENRDDYPDVWDSLPDSYKDDVLDVMHLIDDAILAYMTGHPSTRILEEDPEYDFMAELDEGSEDDE